MRVPSGSSSLDPPSGSGAATACIIAGLGGSDQEGARGGEWLGCPLDTPGYVSVRHGAPGCASSDFAQIPQVSANNTRRLAKPSDYNTAPGPVGHAHHLVSLVAAPSRTAETPGRSSRADARVRLGARSPIQPSLPNLSVRWRAWTAPGAARRVRVHCWCAVVRSGAPRPTRSRSRRSLPGPAARPVGAPGSRGADMRR